jgi:RND family efflux transporter MFP subunit
MKRLATTLFLFWGLTQNAAFAAEASGKVEGFTEPYRQIDLAAGEPGILTDMRVAEGSRVDEHELIGQLDIAVLESSLKIARQRAESLGALHAAEAELELRATYLEQLESLRERGNATQRELDRARADFRVAKARMEMAQEELLLQQLECQRIETQITRRQIYSPIRGVVSHVYREVGEAFSTNDPRVVTIVQLDQLRAKFPLSSQQILRFSPGQAVQIEIQGRKDTVSATVETVAPVMDAKSSTVEVTVAIPNDQERVPSGVRCWLIMPGESSPSDPSRTRYTTFEKQSVN